MEIHKKCGGVVRLVDEVWRCQKCRKVCTIFATKTAVLTLPPTRNHRQLANWINAQNLVDEKRRAVRADVQQWTSNTDTKIGRLRQAGKGRRGLRLEIKLVKTPEPTNDWFANRHLGILFQHESGETYRRHEEAREWVGKNLHSK